jgi:YVTN family beta-propeller protein
MAVAAGLVALMAVAVPVPALAEIQEFAYVTNSASDTVSVIDTATNTVVATIAVGDNPQGVAVSPDGTRAYVTNGGSGDVGDPGTVSVIDTATNRVIVQIPVGLSPGGVDVTPDGTRAYVANRGSGTVSVIRTAGNTVSSIIPVGLSPVGVAISWNGTRVYGQRRIGQRLRDRHRHEQSHPHDRRRRCAPRCGGRQDR